MTVAAYLQVTNYGVQFSGVLLLVLLLLQFVRFLFFGSGFHSFHSISSVHSFVRFIHKLFFYVYALLMYNDTLYLYTTWPDDDSPQWLMIYMTMTVEKKKRNNDERMLRQTNYTACLCVPCVCLIAGR